MIRLRTLALLSLLVVTPASAQLQVQTVQQPQLQAAPPQGILLQTDTDEAMKTMTLEEAQKRLVELAREKRELNGRLTEALATIDQMTKRGGSLVRAYCESDELSRNTAGETENCGASGYRCAPVEGTCRHACNVTTECAGYFTCDTEAHVCVRT